MTSIIVSFLRDQATERPYHTLALSLLIVPIVYILANEVVRRKARFQTLKGPPGLPLVGNIPDIKYNAAEKYREWSKTYGDVYQIQLGNIPVVVVNSAQSAKEIFGGFSQALSSRPVFHTFHKVCPPHLSATMTND